MKILVLHCTRMLNVTGNLLLYYDCISHEVPQLYKYAEGMHTYTYIVPPAVYFTEVHFRLPALGEILQN